MPPNPRSWGSTKPPVGTPLDFSHPHTSGLRAYYALNEGAGVMAHTPRVPQGYLGSGATWATGKHGAGVAMDGTTGGHIICGDVTLGQALPLAMSMVAWVRLDSTSLGGAFVKYGSQFGATPGDAGCGIGVGSGYMDVPGNEFMMIVETVAWNASGVNIGTGWHHCAGTITQAGDAVLYLDGKAVFSGNGGAYYQGGATLSTLDVGGYSLGAVPRYPVCVIDSAGVWDRILLFDEIRDLMAEPFSLFDSPFWRRYWSFSVAGGPTLISMGGTLTTAGALVKQPQTRYAGTLTTAGALAKRVSRPFAGTLTTAGALVKQAQKPFAGTLTMAGALVKRVSKPFAGTLTTSGALVQTRVVLLSVAGTLTTAGALVKQVGKPFAGTLATSGVLVKRVATTMSGTLTSAGALTKQVSKTMAGTLTSSGALATSRLVFLAVGGTLGFAGSVVLSATINVAEHIRSWWHLGSGDGGRGQTGSSGGWGRPGRGE